MEHYVVLADEMHQLGVGRFPPFLPVVAFELFGEGDISYGCVEPDVQHFAVGTFDGHFHTPVEVAGYGAGLQAGIYPRLALSVNICLPVVFMTFENPLTEPRLVLVEGQKPVFCLFQHGFGTAEHGCGIDKVGGVERCAASLALVAVGVVVAAVRTGAHDVAVGKELLSLFVVVLHRHFFHKTAFFVEVAEILGGGAVVFVAGSARVDVERYSELLERLFYYIMVAVHDVLRRNAFLAGFDGDWHAVFVASADEKHVLTL